MNRVTGELVAELRVQGSGTPPITLVDLRHISLVCAFSWLLGMLGPTASYLDHGPR